ncbi:hypothetical protein [Alloalcanivorax sp.]|uniref:hypothetical protein n=1 Tax=Alloalcanivorax sp. TaxID=3020835 RepID=UPI002ECB6139|nr:hypothetical protein [Pseudomonadota bacterium]
MGTKNETIELQEQIKQVIRELGWSQNLLARKIYTEIHDVDNDREIESFQERLKKELQRPTTKPDKLKRYISIIYRHPEAEHLDKTLNKYVPLGHISEYLSKGMKAISKDAGNASKK